LYPPRPWGLPPLNPAIVSQYKVDTVRAAQRTACQLFCRFRLGLRLYPLSRSLCGVSFPSTTSSAPAVRFRFPLQPLPLLRRGFVFLCRAFRRPAAWFRFPLPRFPPPCGAVSDKTHVSFRTRCAAAA